MVVEKPEKTVPDHYTVLDVIADMDRKYHKEVKQHLTENELERILFDKTCKSLLQILWDPSTGNFYDDVVFKARDGFSGTKELPIGEDLDYVLPDGAYIVAAPDGG